MQRLAAADEPDQRQQGQPQRQQHGRVPGRRQRGVAVVEEAAERQAEGVDGLAEPLGDLVQAEGAVALVHLLLLADRVEPGPEPRRARCRAASVPGSPGARRRRGTATGVSSQRRRCQTTNSADPGQQDDDGGVGLEREPEGGAGEHQQQAASDGPVTAPARCRAAAPPRWIGDRAPSRAARASSQPAVVVKRGVTQLPQATWLFTTTCAALTASRPAAMLPARIARPRLAPTLRLSSRASR